MKRIICLFTAFFLLNAAFSQTEGTDPQTAGTDPSVLTASQTEGTDPYVQKDEFPAILQTEGLEIPVCKATASHGNGNDHEVHTYSGFTLCYRETYEQSEWVAYTLTREKLNSVTGRTNDFRSDTKITTGSAVPKDYTKSGFDRGHLAPAADMEWSIESVHDSFLMSNMSPQTPQFNRGMWKLLEEKVREWVQLYGKVFIVTGPVLEKDSSKYNFIGDNKVSVPEFYYKVLLSLKDDNSVSAIGFILPNRKCEGVISDYAVSVDEVEQRTGLDFYSLLPDEIENSVENDVFLSDWR